MQPTRSRKKQIKFKKHSKNWVQTPKRFVLRHVKRGYWTLVTTSPFFFMHVYCYVFTRPLFVLLNYKIISLDKREMFCSANVG